MATEVLRCERHGVATRLTCVDCGAPICPKCSVRTEVGLKCELHARAPAAAETPARPRFMRPAILLGAGLLVLAAFLLLRPRPGPTVRRPAPLPPVGSWTALPDLTSVRGTTVAVALPDGRVLVAGGGVQAVALKAAEIWDPKAGRWSPAGELNRARRGHQAVALRDGRVLVTGGIAEGERLASAEIYNPTTGRWAETAPMGTPRLGHTMTTLSDGRVLVTGGDTPGGIEGTGGGQTIRADASAEIFDATRGAWSPAGTMQVARFEHTATLLDDGRVLIAGGLGGAAAGGLRPLPVAEFYDPAAGRFTSASGLREGRTNHAAGRLRDGSVLVAGGSGGADADISIASAEIFDPRRGAWETAESLTQGRTGATATALPDGRLLVAAGESRSRGTRRSLSTAELYDVQARRWAPAGRSMACPRSEQAAAPLPDGGVLVVAGDASFPGQAPVAQSCDERFHA